MNKIQLLLSGIGISVLSVTAAFVSMDKASNPSFLKLKSEYSKEEAQEIKGAADYYRKITANQITGEIDPRDVLAAREDANRLSSPAFKKTRAFTNMSWSETGPNNVGGRTRIVVADKSISNKLYMGAVGGGFWMSTDNGNTWSKRDGNDSSTAIAVSSIAQAANGDIYYGTGEGIGGFAGSSYVAQIFQLGEGIFKSTDGGATFTQLTSTKPSNSNSANDPWSYVNKIVADPNNANHLIAATFGGLKVTTDGGATWAKPTGLTSVSSHFFDVEISTDGSKVIASTANNAYISNDGGVTFGSNITGTGGLPAGSAFGRVEVAIAPSDANYVYLAGATGAGALKGVYKSTDGGATWTSIALGGGSYNPFGNQGTYDIAFGVHPTNKEMIFMGGQLELDRYTPTSGWKAIAFWQPFGGIGSMVHADMHCIAFNPNDPENMYTTNDGGFYRTTNCSALQPSFSEKNKNYSVTQCYGIAANFMGFVTFGSQDNGSGMMGQEANSPLESRDLTGGDGTRCAMSDFLPNFIFTSVVEGELRRAADGGQGASSFKSFFDKNIDDADPSGAPDEGGLWVSPIEFKEKKVGNDISSIFLFGSNSSVWMTQGALKGNPVWFKLYSPGGLGFSALSMSPDGSTVFAATQNGSVFRITVPNLWTTPYKYDDTVANVPPTATYTYPLYSQCITKQIATYSGRFVTDLACDATGNTLVVTLANYGNTSYIYKCTNAKDTGTLTFTDITSNMPKMPVHSVITLNGSNSKFMIGTELGIWGTDNGGSSWTELNKMNADPSTWHPRVATYEIIEKDLYQVKPYADGYQHSIVYSGTHGRGTFRSTSLSTYFPTSASLVGEHSGKISVYPNPAVDQVNIKYDAETGSNVSVRVYTLNGSLVYDTKVATQIGQNVIPVNISTFAKGGYIVYLNDNGKKASATLIKQ